MKMLDARQVNAVQGMGAFLRSWLGGEHSLLDATIEPTRAETGNINIAGTAWASESLLLSPTDARFQDFIEPGVRALVGAVIGRGWISYTSCEGHAYPDGAADERHVGIVPRNNREAAEILKLWSHIAASWEKLYPCNPCELALMRPTLMCDGSTEISGIDLYISKRVAASWACYFNAVSEASDFATERLA